jgi:hypothetical protein
LRNPQLAHFSPGLQQFADPLISPQKVQRLTSSFAPPSLQQPGDPLCKPQLAHSSEPALQQDADPLIWPHFAHSTTAPAFAAGAAAFSTGSVASASLPGAGFSASQEAPLSDSGLQPKTATTGTTTNAFSNSRRSIFFSSLLGTKSTSWVAGNYAR